MRRKDGFTLIELLVVIAIIAILAAILFPVFLTAREKAKLTSCQSRLRQISVGVQGYMSDWNDTFPIDDWQFGKGPKYTFWFNLVGPYMKNKALLLCPSTLPQYRDWIYYGQSYWSTYAINSLVCDPNAGGSAYGLYYTTPVKPSTIRQPSRIILMWDATRPSEWCLRTYSTQGRHLGGDGFLFCDGHVRWYKTQGVVTSANYVFTLPTYRISMKANYAP